MPSVVYGPGKHEGSAAELPPRPTSLWECLADHADKMDVHQLRRVAMLLLRIVCAWRLEDIGRAFDLHKGHVSRETDRAREEMAEVLQAAGIDISHYTQGDATGEKRIPWTMWLKPDEVETIRIFASRAALSASKQSFIWMMLGGLHAAIVARRDAADAVVETEAA